MPNDAFRRDGVPWLGLAALLLLCAARGLWFTHGLSVPTDADTVRDIGFIHGILDGNALGDPAIGGAWRWYPPLFHVLAAGIAHLAGLDPLPFWMGVGTWLNLATPAAFFVMNRRLFGAWQALAATAVMVLFGGSFMRGDEAAGYTPWTYTPALAWPCFFLGVACAHRVVPALRFGGALAIGCVLGAVFLAHTVPAILLSGIVAALALSRPDRRRAVAWLALAGGMEAFWAVPFLGPLLLDYRLRIANPVPGAWVHSLFDDPQRMLILSLPALCAMAVLLLTRTRSAVGTWVALGTWGGLCLAFLGRQALCAEGLAGGALCRVFVIAPHHFHVYLQAAEACVTGLALVVVARRLAQHWRPLAAGMALLVAGAGAVGIFFNPWDAAARAGALATPRAMLDRDAYDWIVGHTSPADRFVTLLPREADLMGPAAATVLAAGRSLVAPPEVHSNPYIPWAPLNARRLAYLRAPAMAAMRDPAYLLLPAGMPWPGPAMFRSAEHAVYWVGGVSEARTDPGPAATGPKPDGIMTNTRSAQRARPG